MISYDSFENVKTQQSNLHLSMHVTERLSANITYNALIGFGKNDIPRVAHPELHS